MLKVDLHQHLYLHPQLDGRNGASDDVDINGNAANDDVHQLMNVDVHQLVILVDCDTELSMSQMKMRVGLEGEFEMFPLLLIQYQ